MKTITLEKFLPDKKTDNGGTLDAGNDYFNEAIDQCAKLKLYLDTTELIKIIERSRWQNSKDIINGRSIDYNKAMAVAITEQVEDIIKCMSTN